MNNEQPSPYSAAAIEATIDHLRQRIRELEADRDAFRDSALAAESILRQGSDALARILGRDEGLPLTLHLPTVRMIVAGLQEAQRELDDQRDAALAVMAAFSSGDCVDLDELGHTPAWRNLRALVKP